MDLTISEKNSIFFKQIWKILGITGIPINDLVYEISYKLNLPYRPATVIKKIQEALTQGILKEKDKILFLNQDDMNSILDEQHNMEKKVSNMQVPWNRFEESYDTWMNSTERKTEIRDKKSLKINSVIKKVMNEDAIEKGKEIPISQYHPILIEKGIEGIIHNKNMYNFKIDLQNKIILHNCSEFIHHLSEKYLCKHFFRIFMYLKVKDMDLLKDILISLLEEKNRWQFKKN
ncbi:MAG: hypothetical protein JW776_03425 [Candidatus Lokiarchaeota archaeon]|nr:hypothetical protein [Candidatus Lokiarchaeota archaeon]